MAGYNGDDDYCSSERHCSDPATSEEQCSRAGALEASRRYEQEDLRPSQGSLTGRVAFVKYSMTVLSKGISESSVFGWAKGESSLEGSTGPMEAIRRPMS